MVGAVTRCLSAQRALTAWACDSLAWISRASRWRVASTSSAPGGGAASGWRVTPPGSSAGSSSPYSDRQVLTVPGCSSYRSASRPAR